MNLSIITKKNSVGKVSVFFFNRVQQHIEVEDRFELLVSLFARIYVLTSKIMLKSQSFVLYIIIYTLFFYIAIYTSTSEM